MFFPLWLHSYWIGLALEFANLLNYYCENGGKFYMVKLFSQGNSLAVQWSGLRTFTAEGAGSIPGRGTKVPQAVWYSQKNYPLKAVYRIIKIILNGFHVPSL